MIWLVKFTAQMQIQMRTEQVSAVRVHMHESIVTLIMNTFLQDRYFIFCYLATREFF